MDNFQSIGKSANNVFRNILSNQITNIHNRHLARILSLLEEKGVDDSIVQSVKKEIGFYGNDIKNVILVLGSDFDEK